LVTYPSIGAGERFRASAQFVLDLIRQLCMRPFRQSALEMP